MNEQNFLDTVLSNPINAALLSRLPTLGLSDVWLVSGSLFQTAWNVITGRSVAHGIKDYDVFYHDPDTSWDAEDRVIKACAALFEDLDAEVEVRNQARVHLWFPQKFGVNYPALSCSTDAIDRFLATACMVGVSPTREVYAPRGLKDLAEMTLRPNRSPFFSASFYKAKAQRWQAEWPELRVISVEGAGPAEL